MNPRTTGVLVLVAALLGGFIYFYELEGESSRKAAIDEKTRIHPGLKSQDVDAIELTTQDGTEARFERVDGHWMLVSPVTGRADATALDAIAHAMTSIQSQGSVAVANKLEDYGLGDDAEVVRFEVGGEVKGLRMGASTPVGGHLYVARLSDDEVAYIDRFRINAIHRSLDDLRDRSLFDLAAAELRTLRISWPGVDGRVEVALALDEQGVWQMGVPAVGKADQQTIRDLITNLSYLRVKGFLDAQTEEVEAALSEPLLTFHWTLPGDHVERRALVGDVLGRGNVVELPDGTRVTVLPERVAEFERRVASYRYKMVSEFELTNARRLSLDFARDGGPAISVEAVLDDAGWSSSEPEIDSVRASDLVRALSNLRAEDIFADELGEAELESLGLSPPRVRIQVETALKSGASREMIADLVIGRLDDRRGIFAQRSGATEVYLLPLSASGEIPISFEEFEQEFEARVKAAEVDGDGDGEEIEPAALEVDSLDGVEIP